MKSILKHLFSLLLFLPTVYGQKNQIKQAQKELKAGNSEQVLAVLSPIEYLISNAPDEDKIYFYYTKGSALLDLASKGTHTSKNLSQAALAFGDLIQVEEQANNEKFTPMAKEYLLKIKSDFVNSAKEDLIIGNFAESSNKFLQAYLIDKKDTLQLYNAALSYKNGDEIDLALKCFEELKAVNYLGNVPVYIAFSKKTLKDEYFSTREERNAKIQSGTHLRPREEFHSKKSDIYKSIALIYVQKGFKEKAIKAIALARTLNVEDQSLAIVEANLYLQTKDYDYFDNLVAVIIETNPNDAELFFNFGMNCQKEQYTEGAEYYYRKAITIDPLYTAAYINLSALFADKSIDITSAMNNLGSSLAEKKRYEELKTQKEQIVKMIIPYLQKVVSIDPFNTSVNQLVNIINKSSNIQSGSFAANE